MSKLLMIDNYDSFTYNLVQYFAELGCEVSVYRNDKISVEDIHALAPDYLVISPGPCTPNEAGVSLEVIEAFAGKIPMLGVCLGHQSIAQAFGGQVIRADEIMHGKVSEIYHDGTGLYQNLPSPLKVTRYHSLIAESLSLPECLAVTAYSKTATGEKIIMSFSHKQYAVHGVQYHPESILTEGGKQILKNFLSLA